MLFFTLSEIFTQSVDSFQVCNHSLRVKYNMMTLLWVICLTFVWKDQTGRSHFLPMTLRNGLMEWGKILLAESKALQARVCDSWNTVSCHVVYGLTRIHSWPICRFDVWIIPFFQTLACSSLWHIFYKSLVTLYTTCKSRTLLYSPLKSIFVLSRPDQWARGIIITPP